MVNLQVSLAGLPLKNPIMPASGCFGYGREFEAFYSLDILGAIVVKSITPEPKQGNPSPRIAETPSGMLNAIGLQNPGVEYCDDALIHLKQYQTPVICNVAADTQDGYKRVVEILGQRDDVSALEVNISCPNVKRGGMAFGTDASTVYELTKALVHLTDKPLLMKLSPNVTDIVSIAKAAEEGGADGISMINTLLGMRLDLNTGRPIIANGTGGLSGPAIKPVAVRMIYQVYQAVNIPVIGMGGISCVDDVIEFAYAGASAVAVGAYNFVNPYILKELVEDLPRRLNELGFSSWQDAVGFAHRP